MLLRPCGTLVWQYTIEMAHRDESREAALRGCTQDESLPTKVSAKNPPKGKSARGVSYVAAKAATHKAIREKEGAASSAPTESWCGNRRLRWPAEQNQKSRRDAGATKGGVRHFVEGGRGHSGRGKQRPYGVLVRQHIWAKKAGASLPAGRQAPALHRIAARLVWSAAACRRFRGGIETTFSL
jgi:hypothetical protein